MRTDTLHIRRVMMALLTVLSLIACSKEEGATGPFDVYFSTRLQSAETVSRAETYQDISNHFSNTELGIYIDNDANTITQQYKVGYSEGAYTSSIKLENDNYHCYGYMPSDISEEASFDYTGNVLTITDVPAINAAPLTAALPKSFSINGEVATINLQMNQLMAKVTFQFTLPAPYADMRQIEITGVRVTTPDNTANNTAVVTYGETGFTTTWTSVEGTAKTYATVAYSGTQASIGYPSLKALRLTKGKQEFGACYIVPGTEARLQLEVTYNVYDMSDNETRHEAHAVNSNVRISPTNTSELYTIEAGKNYILNISVLPTYLYALSDFDLSSPHIMLD